MKTENTLENKAKFFAQYWGCKVLKNELLNLNIPAHKIGMDNCRGSREQYLELKPLLQISNEDAEQVIGLQECRLKRSDVNSCCYGMSPSGIFVNSLLGHNSFYLSHREVDYLRTKGYAIRWTNLKVEDLISYGWIKLNEQS